MVDWKGLFEKWNEVPESLRKQIIDTMIEKAKKDVEQRTSKFNDWLLENEGRRDIWLTYGLPEYNLRKKGVAAVKPVMGPKPAAAPTPTKAPAPKITKILSKEEMRRLQDIWITEFFRTLGKVPPNVSAVFRVEFEQVKTEPYDVAKEAIMKAADQIIEEIRARETVKRAIKPPVVKIPKLPPRMERIPHEEEERIPAPMGRVPPAKFPPLPLSPFQPFPRGPTSAEQIRLWQVFCYRMEQEGFDCNVYRRDFEQYIENTQFLSWEDLRNKFDFFVNAIMAGQALPPLEVWTGGITVPTGLRGEIEKEYPTAFERIEQYIIHFTKVLIINRRHSEKPATIQDLYDELVDRGLLAANIPYGPGTEFDSNVKRIVRAEYAKKDSTLGGISPDEIEYFLSS